MCIVVLTLQWVGSIDLAPNEEADANIVVKPAETWAAQEEDVNKSVESVLGDNKIDALFCVAGGWAGGNASSKGKEGRKEVFHLTEGMKEMFHLTEGRKEVFHLTTHSTGVITPNKIPLTTIVTYLHKSYRSRISNHWATIAAYSVVPHIYKQSKKTYCHVSF